MAHKSGQPRRDLLSAHNTGAGKGDAPRTNLGSQAWRDGYDSIDWSGSVTAFERVGPHKTIKRYGPSGKPDEFVHGGIRTK
jgi:hypothetical protein